MKKGFCEILPELQETTSESLKEAKRIPHHLKRVEINGGIESAHLNRRLPGHVRYQEIHGDVFAIHKLINLIADGLWHDMAVEVGIIFMIKSGTCVVK